MILVVFDLFYLTKNNNSNQTNNKKKKNIDSFEFLNIYILYSYKHRVINKRYVKRCLYIVTTFKSKWLSWADHVWRVRGNTIEEVTRWIPRKIRPLGRPKQRWINRAKEDMNILEIITEEEAAVNRIRWRKVVIVDKGLHRLY